MHEVVETFLRLFLRGRKEFGKILLNNEVGKLVRLFVYLGKFVGKHGADRRARICESSRVSIVHKLVVLLCGVLAE